MNMGYLASMYLSAYISVSRIGNPQTPGGDSDPLHSQREGQALGTTAHGGGLSVSYFSHFLIDLLSIRILAFVSSFL